MKIADYRNIIVADRFGNAALIETAASKKAVKVTESNKNDKYLYSTNHYTIPYMKELGYPVTKHSIVRYEAIRASIEASSLKTKEDLRKTLSTCMPDGVCCHHYADGMGTLWSMIFDPMEKSAEICFGSPGINKWRRFYLNSPVGVQTYTAVLPNQAADNGFWDKI